MKILHVVIVLVAMSLTNCDQSNETHKPNIILIMADDLGYNDVSSYRSLHTIDYENPPTSQTPAIDKLADEGMLFTDFYSGSPVCSPRSEEHTSELQSRGHLVCRLLLEKKKKQQVFA